MAGGAEGVLAKEAGAGVCRGSDCFGGGLVERELDGEAEGEGDGDGEGDGGLLIVIAGAGVAGTCFSISTSLPFSCTFTWSRSCSLFCFSLRDMSAVFSSRAFSSLSISPIVLSYRIRVRGIKYTETVDAQTSGPFPARHGSLISNFSCRFRTRSMHAQLVQCITQQNHSMHETHVIAQNNLRNVLL